MQEMTRKEAVIKGLELLGWTRVRKLSLTKVAFENPDHPLGMRNGKKQYAYVDRNGKVSLGSSNFDMISFDNLGELAVKALQRQLIRDSRKV